ncbi:hypothetical protein [Enterocloster sp.]
MQMAGMNFQTGSRIKVGLQTTNIKA